jgi:hypothetical protein
MKLKTQMLAIVLGLAASTSLVWSADRPERETTRTIEGVWQVTRCRADCESGECIGGPVPALITFNRDGTLTAYANHLTRVNSVRHLPRALPDPLPAG